MEAMQFVTLCQSVSNIPPGLTGIRNVPKEMQVIYKGTAYYPESYILSFDRGKKVFKGQLHDLRANAVVIAPLAHVKLRQ